MKRRLLPGAALAVTATLALAGPASAASWIDPGEPTYVPTPAGQLDHYVYEYENEIQGHPRRTSRMEAWVSADRSRTVSTRDGALATEEVTEGSEWRTFFAAADEIRIRPLKRPGRPVLHTLRSQAAILREQLDRGYLKSDGEAQVGGRRALVLVDGPNDPDRHHNSERLLVDPDSFVVLEAEIRATGYKEDSDETIQTVSRRRLVLNETVDLAANEASLRFGDHPGATIVRAGADQDTYSARNRAKNAKAKAKRAKARAKARRRAAKRAGRSRASR